MDSRSNGLLSNNLLLSLLFWCLNLLKFSQRKSLQAGSCVSLRTFLLSYTTQDSRSSGTSLAQPWDQPFLLGALVPVVEIWDANSSHSRRWEGLLAPQGGGCRSVNSVLASSGEPFPGVPPFFLSRGPCQLLRPCLCSLAEFCFKFFSYF